MPNTTPTGDDKNLPFWNALHDQLAAAKASIPFCSEPERIHWSHPDEDWKNQAEVEALEEEAWPDTDAIIAYYCQHHKWPKRSKNDARFFADQRITWARRFTRLLTIPDQNGNAAIPRPPQSGWDLLRWLLTDAYRQRRIPTPDAPMIFCGPEELGVPTPFPKTPNDNPKSDSPG